MSGSLTIKDRVFVLSLTPYRGSDLIVNFLSQDLGKLTAVIYGGKKINKDSSFLYQPGDLIELEYEKKENKEFIKVLNSYGYKLLAVDRFSYQRFLFHTYLMEIASRISKPELASPELYSILIENNLLDWEENGGTVFMVWALWKIIQAGGYQIDYSCCITCRKQTWRMNEDHVMSFRKQIYGLDVKTGNIICHDCSANSSIPLNLDAAMIKVMWLYTQYSDFDESLKTLPEEVLNPLVKILNSYLLTCFEIKPKSLESFMQLIDKKGC